MLLQRVLMMKPRPVANYYHRLVDSGLIISAATLLSTYHSESAATETSQS